MHVGSAATSAWANWGWIFVAAQMAHVCLRVTNLFGLDTDLRFGFAVHRGCGLDFWSDSEPQAWAWTNSFDFPFSFCFPSYFFYVI